MRPRRATVAIHGLLAVALGLVAAWLLWISFSYVPDPINPWPVGPEYFGVPMAIALAAAAAVLPFVVRSWVRSGNRAPLAVADLLIAGTLVLCALAIPGPIALGMFAILVVAGGSVAANRPSPGPSDIGQR